MNTLVAALTLLPIYQESQEETIPLAFGWPEEGRCEVFEEISKKGNEATMRYDLRWAPLEGEDGEGILVEYKDLRFIEFNGMDATDPLIAKALAQVTAITSAIPKIKIDPKGHILGFGDYGRMIQECLEFMGEVKGLTEEEFEAVKAMLHQPQIRQTMQTKAAETWNYWVGYWADTEVVRGSEEVWELDMEETGGVVPELRISYGDLAEYRGVECIEIRMIGRADEKVLLQMLLQMMGLMAESTDLDVPDNLPIYRATKTLTVEGIYAVDGLRPLEVHTSDKTKIWERATEEPQAQVEEHSYYFDWLGIEPHGQD